MGCITCDSQSEQLLYCMFCNKPNDCKSCLNKRIQEDKTCKNCNKNQSIKHLIDFDPNIIKKIKCNICTENFTTKRRIQFICEKGCYIDNGEYNCVDCQYNWICTTNEQTGVKCISCKTNLKLSNLSKYYSKIKIEKIIQILNEINVNIQIANKQKYKKEALKQRLQEEKNKKLKEIDKQISTLQSLYNDIYYAPINITDIDTTKSCPGNFCKGVLNSDNYCMICENIYCDICLKKKESNHECNQDDIKTIELLKKETKACPYCGAQSEKVNGCYMVFCLICKNLWDWTHNKILDIKLTDRRAHNPDLSDYLKQKKINQRIFLRIVNLQNVKENRKKNEIFANLCDFFSFINHIIIDLENDILYQYQIDFESEIINLNAKYINDKITKEYLLISNLNITKKIEKNTIFNEIIVSYCREIRGILHRVSLETVKKEPDMAFLNINKKNIIFLSTLQFNKSFKEKSKDMYISNYYMIDIINSKENKELIDFIQLIKKNH